LILLGIYWKPTTSAPHCGSHGSNLGQAYSLSSRTLRAALSPRR
jgi:hypothetical protein